MSKSTIQVHLIPALLSLALLLVHLTASDRVQQVVAARAAVVVASALVEAETALPPSVVLRAASGATIRFSTQNGATLASIADEKIDVPYLVLYRNDALTDPAQRTLVVEVRGIEVPREGVAVTFRIETQHRDPDEPSELPPRIPVWSETRWLTNTTGVLQTGVSLTLEHEFGESVLSGAGPLATPTDYFRYELAVTDPRDPSSGSAPILQSDYAFLMENQWIEPLPQVPEQSPGAAPDELAVYYCDMFPVRQDLSKPDTWVPRQDLARYLRTQLIPAMVDAFRLQSEGWGFPWYEEWTSWRDGADAHRLSVALSDGSTWFHGHAPSRGDASMSIDVSSSNPQYATLTDGLMWVFHHELFHQIQRNIFLHYGGTLELAGRERAWAFFVEGTAVLATSVGQPSVQFDRTRLLRSYMLNAHVFLGSEGFLGGKLNNSYSELNPYLSAAYWRFLYEQCGGMAAGVEDPAAGMEVIRQVLLALYGGEIVDIDSSTDMVAYLPAIVNRALERASCPFDTYEASLHSFGRAVYGLRLEGGRCFAPGTPFGCGFYDPATLYPNPPVDAILYRGGVMTYGTSQQRIVPGIRSSFGLDLVNIALDRSLNGQSLSLDFYGDAASPAQFAVQVWKLMASAGDSESRAVVSDGLAPEFLGTSAREGHLLYTIPAIDIARYDQLGLAITRVDAQEGSDPHGSYTIVLQSGTADQ